MHRRWWHTLHSWIVVAIAPATLGLLTFAAFWYAAARLRSRVVALSAAGYTAATVLEFVWAGSGDSRPAPGFGWMIAVTLLVGTGHLIAIRPRLSQALAASAPADEPELPAASTAAGALEQDPAYLAAVTRRARREKARALVSSDPALATELGIGRPDLDRDFDDGGLVDVNQVLAPVLATLPGFTAELADAVTEARDRVGGQFFSADDLVVFAGVPANVVESVRDRLLFRPV
jgi:DNA uptake protein ComE-like DNA-binding protein